MILQTKQLREFLKWASPIKRNDLIPVTDHVSISPGSITKTNLTISCTMDIDAKENVLIEEKTLAALLNATKEETIKITTGKNISLQAGDLKITHPLTPIEQFPSIHSLPESDPIELTEAIIDSLVVAKSFISEMENDGTFKYVHMQPKYIAATDRFKLYYESYDTLPSLVMHPDDIDLISKMDEPKLYYSEKYYSVKSGNVIYHFVKTEWVTPNFIQLKDRFNVEGTKFNIEKQDIVEFCNLANAVTDSKLAECVICSDGFGLNDTDKTIMKPMKFPDINFKFSSRTILPAVKSIPLSTFNCELIYGAIIIKEKNLLIGLMPQI